jgi:hypothetical protein
LRQVVDEEALGARITIAVGVAWCLTAGRAQAVDRYWVGSAGGNWSASANWSTASGGQTIDGHRSDNGGHNVNWLFPTKGTMFLVR